MKSKKIASIIASTLVIATLTGCNINKNKINKEGNKNQETKIEKQEQNNTELDKKTDEEIEDKKSLEEENKDIKKVESDKDKVNIESKKDSKSDDLPKSEIKNKKISESKSPKKQKNQEKKEYKKEEPKQSDNKKESIKENRPEPKKNIPQEEKVQKTPKQANDSFIAEIEQMIFRKVNEERAKLGIAPLTYNYTMQKYARDKSFDMGSKDYFRHQDLSGKLITENMKKDGVYFNAWGENIAYVAGYTGNANISNQFMTRWMNSIGHRKNILSQNFKSIGIGVYKIGSKYYATQEFYR